MRETFIEKSFTRESERLISIVNGILDEYAAEGFDLSLRQLYYQLVARGYIENSERSYKRIGSLVSDARLAGLIDWNMITDRGRVTVAPPRWSDPAEIVEAAAQQFAIDKWEDQDYFVMVMVEKQALEGVLIPVCHDLGIDFAANKGYSSSSAMYETSKRLVRYMNNGKDTVILYLGDHDPSGIDMTRDIRERMNLFVSPHVIREVEVNRLALNMDQVEALNPPENPAKLTDSRASMYIAKFGLSSWELDAIEPRALANIVTDAVYGLRDADKWDAAVSRENDMRAELRVFVDTYRNGNSKSDKSRRPKSK